MEMILISSNKLKIMLDREDMESYSLSCDTIDYDNTETRRAFWNILDDAKHKTGFDAASDRVFIQVYPSKNGGCEMFVTKVREGGKSRSDRNVSCLVSKNGAERTDRIYAFSRLSDMMIVCRRLKNSGFSDISRAYAARELPERYFLLLPDTGCCGELPKYPFIYEYIENEYTDDQPICELAASSYITEHCRCICSAKAVETLSELI